MKSSDLLNYIGNVDDAYIEEVAFDAVTPIRRRKGRVARILVAAACLALIVFCASVLFPVKADVRFGELQVMDSRSVVPMAHNSVVMLDVNPSLQLEVNDRGIVVRVEALNDDGSALMEELPVVNWYYTDAVQKAISVLKEHGYITDLKNSVLVTVCNPDATYAEQLRSVIVDAINIVDENTDYDLSVLSQILTDISAYADIAERYHMSAGRAELIQKICADFERFGFDDLADSTVQTINQLLEYIGVPESVLRVGAVAATVPDSFREKLGLDELDGTELINFTKAISDFYDKLCKYYKPSDVANQIGYVLKIVCGENDDGTRLWAVLVENLADNTYSHGAIINTGSTEVGDLLRDARAVYEFVKYVS